MSNKKNQDLVLTDAQVQIITDPHRFRVVCCGRRFGKSFMSVEEIKAFALLRGGRIAYIGPTHQQTRDIAWDMLLKTLHGVILSKNEARLELKVNSQAAEPAFIVLRGFESIETLRGQSFDFIVIDEVAMMRNFNEKWEEVIRPTLTDRKGQVLFLSTPKGYNHFFDLFEREKRDNDFKSFKFTTYDNPYIPVEELEKARQELTENRFAQEYMADFRKVEGLVFPEFERHVHCFDDTRKIDRVERLVGIDWGYSVPTGMLVIDRDAENNYFVREEYYKTNKTTDEIIQVAGTYMGNKYYPDPAEPDRIEQMRLAGLNVQEVRKRIQEQIDSVRSFFKNRKLFIHRDCHNLIFELENYAYDIKEGKQTDKPIDENDHLINALEYVMHQQTFRTHMNSSKTYIPSFLRK